ncbi:MAG TPA: hypothetical protein VGO57_01565 [Verrucomicrobiae bacterium]|jgi:hypothetical protein
MKYWSTAVVGLIFILVTNAFCEVMAADVIATTAKPFQVFDNMFYAGKPDFTTNGIIPSCVVYETKELKDAVASGQLPDEATFKEKIRTLSSGHPGPIVIDIEYAYLSKVKKTTDADVRNHFKLFITLAHWAHEAAPGHLVGYYGHGLFPEEPGKEYAAETKELLGAMDAFFPSLYSHGNQSPAQWKAKLQILVQQARQLAPDKPIYPYVWAQYHEGGPKALEFLDADYMKFQLETAQACGVDGVVFWSSRKPAWVDRPWAHAMVDFVAAKPRCETGVKTNLPNPGKTSIEPE